jgi:hypothetical protein
MLTKEQLQDRSLLVRIHEANCQVLFPTPVEINFRIAIAKKIAFVLELKELRETTIAGPVERR